MRPPNQIIANVILQYKDKRTGLRLTFQMFYVLGNGAQGNVGQFRGFFRLKTVEAHSAPWPGIRISFKLICVSQVT